MIIKSPYQNQISTPLVSIIVITYNSSKYVLETLESAKAQTYENIELIVSDDCSTDNTIEICKNWIEENKRRFVRTEVLTSTVNTGTPANANRGVKIALGEWIKFIAGDDILLPNCILENLNYSLENSCDFLFSDLIWFNDYTVIKDPDNSEVLIRKKFLKTDSKSRLHFYSRYPVFLNTPTWFLSKKNFEKNSFDEEFKILEDQTFVYTYLEKGGQISYLNRETVKYRKHTNSVLYLKGSNFVNDFELCFNRYRKKNLKYHSVIDLLFIIKFKISLLKIINSEAKFKRYCAAILLRINPISIFKISPSFLLRANN